jgi:hypothetical protein
MESRRGRTGALSANSRFERGEEQVAVAGALADEVLAQQAQQMRAMAYLRVSPLLSICRRAIQTLKQLVLGDRLNILTLRDRVTAETLAVVVGKSVWIGDEPSFYRLNH